MYEDFIFPPIDLLLTIPAGKLVGGVARILRGPPSYYALHEGRFARSVRTSKTEVHFDFNAAGSTEIPARILADLERRLVARATPQDIRRMLGEPIAIGRSSGEGRETWRYRGLELEFMQGTAREQRALQLVERSRKQPVSKQDLISELGKPFAVGGRIPDDGKERWLYPGMELGISKGVVTILWSESWQRDRLELRLKSLRRMEGSP